MTNAPKKIWAEPDGETLIIHNGSPDLEGLIATGYIHEYTRADIAQARIAQLEGHISRLVLEIETTKAEAARVPHSRGLNPRVKALKETS
tara:strand:- start:55 stop:324 length:270 start_codon:yes stop_codon:yes gene_type:complete